MSKAGAAVGTWALVCSALSSDVAGELVCAAGQQCVASNGPQHYWPTQKGDTSRSGKSAFREPGDITLGPKWKWTYPHADVVRSTPLIDDQMNIYVITNGGWIYKLSAEGVLLWQTYLEEKIVASGALHEHSIYVTTVAGNAVAIDAEAGGVVWKVRLSMQSGHNTPSVLVTNGTVVVTLFDDPTLSKKHEIFSGTTHVAALRASDGSVLWRFKPDIMLYNFQACDAGDGILVFQDKTGELYKVRLEDGGLVWRSGATGEGFFTTGAAVLHGGKAFTVANLKDQEETPGVLRVYDVASERLLWERQVPYAANQAVAVGQLRQGQPVSAVIGIGENMGPCPSLVLVIITLPFVLASFCSCCLAGARKACGYRWSVRWPTQCLLGIVVLLATVHWLAVLSPTSFAKREVYQAMVAFEAATGELQWWYELPRFNQLCVSGDEEKYWTRIFARFVCSSAHDDICLPDSCAQPVIGGNGTVFQGWQDGHVYAIRDKNGDGLIHPSKEVSRYFVGEAFQAPVALAPGMLVVAPCGGALHVFKN